MAERLTDYALPMLFLVSGVAFMSLASFIHYELGWRAWVTAVLFLASSFASLGCFGVGAIAFIETFFWRLEGRP